MQAIMASDFAIARFRFLKKLLLVHGKFHKIVEYLLADATLLNLIVLRILRPLVLFSSFPPDSLLFLQQC